MGQLALQEFFFHGGSPFEEMGCGNGSPVKGSWQAKGLTEGLSGTVDLHKASGGRRF